MKVSEGLEVLLNRIDLIDADGFTCGLCGLKWRFLWLYSEDCKKIGKYIDSNAPISRLWFKLWNGGYWWKPGLVEPRKKWLEKHIKKLKTKGL